jgi:hypothetical protein
VQVQIAQVQDNDARPVPGDVKVAIAYDRSVWLHTGCVQSYRRGKER